MSRSIRHTPISPVCTSTGNHLWKKQINRSMRHLARQGIHEAVKDIQDDLLLTQISGEDLISENFDFLPSHLDEIQSEYGAPGDGKMYFGGDSRLEYLMRK